MSIYQIGFLGAPSDNQRAELTASLGDLIRPFGLTLGTDVAVLDSAACLTHPPKVAFAAAYFGDSRPDLPSITAARALVRENLPIIPVVPDLKGASRKACAAARIRAQCRTGQLAVSLTSVSQTSRF